MVFVADALGAWLIGLLADRGRRRLTTVMLGSDQERALRRAAMAAVRLTAGQLSPDGDEQAHLAVIIGEVFSAPVPVALRSGQGTLLEALQASIAGQLAVLGDAALTRTRQPSGDVLGVSGELLARRLTGNLLREIVMRGSGGGPLFPLASQLNDDVTHLQSQQIQGALHQLGSEILGALSRLDDARTHAAAPDARPVWLPPRPTLMGRGDLLTDLHTRLAARPGKPQIMALYGLGGVGKTSVAIEYAHRQLPTTRLVWQFPAEDPAVLAAEFARLAAVLGAVDQRDPVASVQAVLAASPQPWLLIFDNAPDEESVQGFLPSAGNGQVLITSQSALWPPGTALEVPVLGTEVAASSSPPAPETAMSRPLWNWQLNWEGCRWR
jgi:hypothetical protein